MSEKNEFEKLRLEKGLTQKEVAELTGYSERSVQNWSQGRRKPSKLVMKTLKDK